MRRFFPDGGRVVATARPRATGRALNDADLSAEAARRDERVPGSRVLCLTLGFGPGGALLERTSTHVEPRSTVG
jgi:hypothetical protein